MKTWEKASKKLVFSMFLVLFGLSFGAVAQGITEATTPTPTPAVETVTPAPETTEMLLIKEEKDSGEIVFRLMPADEVEEITEEDESDFEGEETEKAINGEKAVKLFLVRWDGGLEPAELPKAPVYYVQEPQPTEFIRDTGSKILIQYAGDLDYDAILQLPPIYDFGDEGKLALMWMVWHEARGEPFDGQVAVAAVAINRLYSDCPWFTDKSSIIGIVSQKYQFAYCYVSEADLAAYPDVERAVEVALRGADPTVCDEFPEGCMWYYNPKDTDATFPNAKCELVIGQHHFHNNGDTWH